MRRRGLLGFWLICIAVFFGLYSACAPGESITGLMPMPTDQVVVVGGSRGYGDVAVKKVNVDGTTCVVARTFYGVGVSCDWGVGK